MATAQNTKPKPDDTGSLPTGFAETPGVTVRAVGPGAGT